MLTGEKLDCRVPKVLRQKAGTDLAAATLRAAPASSSTVLVRPVGTHGGDFEKIEGSAALTAVHYQVLRESQRRIGLDYFGVDCGLDRSGNLVMFEANASMLVHDQNERKFVTDSRGN